VYVYGDIKSYICITRENKEEDCNEEIEEATEDIEEPVQYIKLFRGC